MTNIGKYDTIIIRIQMRTHGDNPTRGIAEGEEDMDLDSMLRALNQYPNGTNIIVETLTGDKIVGHIDTIYETDNELPEEDPEYEEYYSCVIQVSAACKTIHGKKLMPGELTELCKNDPILRITLENGTTIWQISV